MSKSKGFLGKIFNPKWDTILNQIINLLFLFFGSRIKGYRTIIVNTITAIVGALLAFQAEPMLNFLCSINVEIFCNGENSIFVGYVMVVIGLLNNILRKVTDDQVKLEANPGAFRVQDVADPKYRAIAVVSAAGLVAAIVSMFV